MAPRKKSITPKYFGQRGVSDKIPRIAYTANTLRFQSEEDLEIYIENHFDELFPDLEILHRQFRLHSQRYDLLCRNKHNHQAVLLELKNEEDRSIVWQLVRYRHLVQTEQPLPEQIDYSLPIELIAITPSFHEDSLIDKAACKFEENIKLLTFSFTVKDKSIKIGNCNHAIPYSVSGLSDLSQFAPKNLLELQNKVPALSSLMFFGITEEYRDYFWYLRSMFLAQLKVKEIIHSGGRKVSYATSNREGSKTLAEIHVSYDSSSTILLFLYLPIFHADLNNTGLIRCPIKLARFEVVITEKSKLLNPDAHISYLVANSTGGIKSQDRENLSISFEQNRLKKIRGGMSKWSIAEDYLICLSCSYKNPIVFEKLYPDLVAQNPEGWWQEFQSQFTYTLSWFVDLAIRAWRYKI